MPVPASINDLSTVAGSNSPPGSESPASLDDYLRAHASFIAQLRDGKLNASAVSAFILTLLDDADGAAARATLGANDASNLTTGTLPDARISNSGAITPSLVNSFTNGGGCRYWKVGNVVYLSLDVERATMPAAVTTIFTLPVGHRPAVTLKFPGYASQNSPLFFGVGWLQISTGGAVIVQIPGPGTSGSTYAISALVSFPAA